jgi:hypothetical protein
MAMQTMYRFQLVGAKGMKLRISSEKIVRCLRTQKCLVSLPNSSFLLGKVEM